MQKREKEKRIYQKLKDIELNDLIENVSQERKNLEKDTFANIMITPK